MAASAILNFAVDETSNQVLITRRDELALEGSEAFTVVLSQPTGETTPGALKRMTVTLVDNEGGAGAVVDGIHVSRRRLAENAGNVAVPRTTRKRPVECGRSRGQ